MILLPPPPLWQVFFSPQDSQAVICRVFTMAVFSKTFMIMPSSVAMTVS
jgi:hypothetical protein